MLLVGRRQVLSRLGAIWIIFIYFFVREALKESFYGLLHPLSMPLTEVAMIQSSQASVDFPMLPSRPSNLHFSLSRVSDPSFPPAEIHFRKTVLASYPRL